MPVLLGTWILKTTLFRTCCRTCNRLSRLSKVSICSSCTFTQNVVIVFTESISTEYHRPTVQEIFGMTPSTSLSSCASSSSSPTFRERSHSSGGSNKGRLSGGTIRTHWPFLRNSQDWTISYLQGLVDVLLPALPHWSNWHTKMFIYPKFQGMYEVLKRSISSVVFGCGTDVHILPCILYCVRIKS
jgi:hypothetical protein